ncbi:hypothetical protein [Abyssogena phaseoliformis symbiont]|uniref:hypothetical protein n=1 Tax=Abyssogena phaseoliformis symbiont TaxID=596095 RepID=UPI001916A684|nr:hypothetical protein [Abyssogena phaseoliformis symbiont]
MKINYISKNAKIGKNTILNPPVKLVGSAHVKHSSNIGKFSLINSGTTIFPSTLMGKNCEIGAFDHHIIMVE